MTEKEKKFADYYLADKESDVGNAYMRAYPRTKKRITAQKSGHRLLQKAGVKEYIDERLLEMKNARTADITECFEFLTSVMRGEVMEQRPMVVSRGMEMGAEIEIEEFRTQPKDRIKAAEAIIKKHQLGNASDEAKALDTLVDAMMKAANG